MDSLKTCWPVVSKREIGLYQNVCYKGDRVFCMTDPWCFGLLEIRAGLDDFEGCDESSVWPNRFRDHEVQVDVGIDQSEAAQGWSVKSNWATWKNKGGRFKQKVTRLAKQVNLVNPQKGPLHQGLSRECHRVM